MPKAARTMPDLPFLRECFAYSPASGALTWRKRPRRHFVDDPHHRMWNTRFAGKIAGTLNPKGYVHIGLNGTIHKAHRLIWKLMTGKDPIAQIDHKDCDKANNRWENLREATSQQNGYNRKATKGSGHAKGITHSGYSKLPWKAQIRVNNRLIYLGCFRTTEEAHAAYLVAAKRYFGKFANPGVTVTPAE